MFGTCFPRSSLLGVMVVSASGPQRETSLYPRNTSTHHCFEVTIHHSSAPRIRISHLMAKGFMCPWYPIMSDGRLKSVNGLEDIELPGRAEQCEVPGAKLPPSVWNMMLSASIRLLPSYVYFEAHSLLYWKSHERYSGFCKHTSFAGYCISRKASCLFGGNASA